MIGKKFVLAVLLMVFCSVGILSAQNKVGLIYGFMTIMLHEDVVGEKLDDFIKSYEDIELKLEQIISTRHYTIGFSYNRDLVENEDELMEERVRKDPNVFLAEFPPRLEHRRPATEPIEVHNFYQDDNQTMNMQSSSTQSNQWNLDMIELNKAFALIQSIPNKNNREIVVAVIDDGFNIDNSEIAMKSDSINASVLYTLYAATKTI